MSVPQQIRGQKYISLATFRRNGSAVSTPVWFGDDDNRLYVMTRNDSGKYKRIRNNPRVQVAPCTVRGKVTGPAFGATARLLPQDDWARARQLIRKKYWLARVPFLWSGNNVYVEIDVSPTAA